MLVPHAFTAAPGAAVDLLDPIREFVRSNYTEVSAGSWPIYVWNGTR
jgi:hypothetical protein